MAFTVTDRGTANANAASVATAAFTPGATKLLLCAISTNGSAFSSIAGHGTWTLISDNTNYNSTRDFWVYGLITSGSPASSAVTVTLFGTTPLSICIVEIGGADVSGTVANAIGVKAINSGYNGFDSGGRDNGVTLAAFASSSNLTFVSTGLGGGGGTTYTAITGFTLVSSTTLNSPAAISYKTSEDSAPAIHSTDNFVNWGGAGFEVKAAASGTDTAVIVPAGPIR